MQQRCRLILSRELASPSDPENSRPHWPEVPAGHKLQVVRQCQPVTVGVSCGLFEAVQFFEGIGIEKGTRVNVG